MAPINITRLGPIGGGGSGSTTGDVNLLAAMANRIASQQAPVSWVVANVMTDTQFGAEVNFLDPYYKFTANTQSTFQALPTAAFARASTAVAANLAGVYSQYASGVMRINDLGFRIEGAATNLVRNPRAEGAIPGSPGTFPTNWANSGVNGLTWNIVGSGSTGGIDYVDIRISGTSSSTSAQTVNFDSAIPASATQVWDVSFFVALVAGTTTGLTSFGPVASYTGGGTINGTANAVALLTATLTRYSDALTAPASSTALSPRMRVIPTNGGVVDATFRIGWPQAIQQSFASSPVLPVAGTPASTTRAADVATMLTSSSLDTSFLAEFIPVTIVGSGGSDQTVMVWDDGTSNNQAALYVAAATGHLTLSVTTGGVSQAVLDLGAVTAGTTYKVAARLKNNDVAACVNGGSIVSTISATLPATSNRRLGHQVGGVNFLYGYLRRYIASYNTRTNAELQAWV